MKGIDENPLPVQVKAEDEERKNYKLIGQLVSSPSLVLWEFEEATKILKPAEILEHQVQIDKSEKGSMVQVKMGGKTYLTEKIAPEVTIHKRVNYRKGCVYFQAINRKNALRKLDKFYKS